MESKRCAKLVLNTSLFYPASAGTIGTAGAMDSSMGYADASRLNSTFTNLDWKQIIGREMWDMYDEFNLVLINATYLSSGGTPFGTASNNLGVIFKAGGLDWVNQTYDVYAKSNTSEAIILSTILGQATLIMPTFNTCTFKKPAGSGVRDFTIKLYRTLDNTQVGGQDRPASFIYMFNIYGVENSPK